MATSQTSVALFACTRCNSRHPFEELSQGQQLCKECRGAYPIVKCTYCRSEFQQENKSSLSSICKKCEQNVKLYGKPSACDYCNIIAAFIGSKCQRCTNSEKKHGPPVPCDQCKQRCAFDRKDPESRKKVDGKLLCWLCTLSYKRALAKAKQNDSSIRHTSISVHKSGGHHSSSRHREHRGEHGRSHRHGGSSNNIGHSNGAMASGKKPRLDIMKSSNGSLNAGLPGANALAMSDNSLMDPSNSEHVVAVTQLKEKIMALQKDILKKDKELMQKDKMIAELRSQHASEQKELREKLNNTQKKHSEKIQELQQKLSQLQKQNATLSKAAKAPKPEPQTTPNDSPNVL